MIEQASLIIGDGNWAVKSDSLLGYKLIDGKYYPRQMSATRATTATRINADGLVELVPYNLLQYSEQFNNGVWTPNAVSITSNSTTAPDGTTTADKIILANGSQTDPIVYQILDTNSSTRTLSFFAKASEYNIAFGRIGGASNSPIVLFQLSGSGSILHNQNVSAYSIEALSNGWYRCSMTYSHGASFAPNVGVCSATYSVTTSSVISTGNGTSGIFIWGAQVVEGSTAKDYLPTTDRLDIARIDYSTGSSALLAEPQRTNNVFWSNNFSPSKAYNYQNASQSSTTITAPDGLPTTGITSDTSSSIFHRFFKSVDASSNTFTSSIYAKQGTSRYLGLGVNHNGSASTNNIVVFDLQDGVIASNPYSITATIELLSNGWYRLTHTYTYTGATAVDICVHNAGVSTYTTSGFQVFDSPTAPTTLYIFGLQFELGSYATSYIPTTSTSVTRNADVLSYSSLNSLDVTKTTNYTWFLDLGNDTIVNNFDIRLGGIGLYLIGTGSQGTQWSLYNFTALNQILSNTNITGNRKICLTYNSGVLKVFANNQLLTTYSGSITSDVLTFLMSNADNRLVLNTLAIFNTTLSDTDALNLIS